MASSSSISTPELPHHWIACRSTQVQWRTFNGKAENPTISDKLYRTQWTGDCNLSKRSANANYHRNRTLNQSQHDRNRKDWGKWMRNQSNGKKIHWEFKLVCQSSDRWDLKYLCRRTYQPGFMVDGRQKILITISYHIRSITLSEITRSLNDTDGFVPLVITAE